MIPALFSLPTLALFGIDWLDPEWIINSLGPAVLIGVCLIVFLETGVLVLAFLPGDSLLFTVGLMTATGIIPYPIVVTCLLVFVAAFLGDQMGFTLGRKLGPAIFSREQSRVFNPANVKRTGEFFKKFGPKAIVLARFLPVFRAFVPAAAGVGQMRRRHFLVYNLIGALLWGVGVTLIGYFLGKIDFVNDYAEYFILGIVFISGIPLLVELSKAGREALRKRAAERQATER
ncbi:DedA family protein [Leucobacter sp. M11]|uniref:DedA family protein n=1 Tax=Leucobacter sp. M11 TaxID=2993565 RepID=UPI002D7ED854|nr:VTT domain-containing protein [Leucobacter sp. M11]MEB4614060.1 VTT domain-containing protein [Leucobacter sp. M11]